ncbi:pyridoxamine 5'-phosphate oxidase family protein [Deinococcus detaillensis]|uniref:Pyridoxamine 5'-phosphate oxidase family protein n=1 Tax=Deinococcus detaillensis TaxID=2592048 RepID=A0A553V2H4_9DEIO|nr:MSMEG_1061 family FMN-dependent PPOX-type flavoprotein [Deinococcus detaillensis]TSA86441.1 pyridoxamine 5'-phosphate oxidase family protein [Deinococcus detaillensis]
MHLDPAHLLSPERLSPLYREPSAAVKAKTSDRISADFARVIAVSPLVVLATGGPNGLDCSPRGDVGQVVYVQDEKTLLLPDRPGNNRIDSVRNILASPSVALIFLVPGVSESFRVNGTAQITTDPALLARFAYKGQLPRSLFVIHVEEAYLHCGRALLRSEVWNAAKHVSSEVLPNFVQMLRDQTKLNLPDDALVIEDR